MKSRRLVPVLSLVLLAVFCGYLRFDERSALREKRGFPYVEVEATSDSFDQALAMVPQVKFIAAIAWNPGSGLPQRALGAALAEADEIERSWVASFDSRRALSALQPEADGSSYVATNVERLYDLRLAFRQKAALEVARGDASFVLREWLALANILREVSYAGVGISEGLACARFACDAKLSVVDAMVSSNWEDSLASQLASSLNDSKVTPRQIRDWALIDLSRARQRCEGWLASGGISFLDRMLFLRNATWNRYLSSVESQLDCLEEGDFEAAVERRGAFVSGLAGFRIRNRFGSEFLRLVPDMGKVAAGLAQQSAGLDSLGEFMASRRDSTLAAAPLIALGGNDS